eukprot:TRINITY_DN77712_c0_g1_i1.p2 TRINITY_DN77712_c0_g1~~TRINITY_DN77712_c0_g1_i1.p2  ORF type:complete len:104 (+),score=6.33 TRINITY_DN77712_c0_g1_i1:72-383(+)
MLPKGLSQKKKKIHSHRYVASVGEDLLGIVELSIGNGMQVQDPCCPFLHKDHKIVLVVLQDRHQAEALIPKPLPGLWRKPSTETMEAGSPCRRPAKTLGNMYK